MRVKSITEEFDTTIASGWLMLTLLSGMAAGQRELTRVRSLAASYL